MRASTVNAFTRVRSIRHRLLLQNHPVAAAYIAAEYVRFWIESHTRVRTPHFSARRVRRAIQPRRGLSVPRT